MEYKTPELTAMKPAINAIQDVAGKDTFPPEDTQPSNDSNIGAYQDWE